MRETYHTKRQPNLRTKRNCALCAEGNHEHARIVAYRAVCDAANITRAELTRIIRAKPAEDQSKLIHTLLHFEAIDVVRHEVEMMYETPDELFAKILYYETMRELECRYAYLYRHARRFGYTKAFASFIQHTQSLRDGRTLDDVHYTPRLGESKNAQEHSVHAFNMIGGSALNTPWNDPDYDTDYLEILDGARDMRSDEVHASRNARWVAFAPEYVAKHTHEVPNQHRATRNEPDVRYTPQQLREMREYAEQMVNTPGYRPTGDD